MVMRGQFGGREVIFLRWLKEDDLTAIESFSQEGLKIHDLAVAKSIPHHGSENTIW
jgi:hypothetical protein